MDVSTLYELGQISVRGPLGTALEPLDLRVRDHAVTALVGPVGSGKSTLLRLLSGRPPSEGWTVDGQWRFHGERVDLRGPLREVAWVPQIRNGPATPSTDPRERDAAQARLDGAFFCGAPVVLLDEPTRGLSPQDQEALVGRLRQHCKRGAAIVISHDLSFIRAIADDVCMLFDGALITHTSASDFFNRPEPDLVRQFIRHGTCAEEPIVPQLPRHFHWHEPQRLAGMGLPGLMSDLDDDLFAIAHAGISLLVSLTEDPLPTTRLRPFGIAGRHFPIRDMRVPSVFDTVALCHELLRAMDRGQVVAVHCRAGLGRTGTILASIAVCQGLRADEAIDRVRRVVPGSIQTEAQAAFVHRVEEQR